MTNREAIEVIKLAQAEVEWEYPMDYAAAFDMAISALQAQEAKRSTYEQGEKMNRQRKVVITVTYNDLGVIVDTKAEELDSSAQPNLQPTCNNLATDAISRTAAIDVLKGLPTWWADEGGYYGGAQPPMVALLDPEDAVSAIENLPSAQPEIVRCKDCKYGEQDEVGRWFCRSLGCQIGSEDGSGFCADADRRTDADTEV